MKNIILASSTGDVTLVEELFGYFKEKYINVFLTEYRNLGFGEESLPLSVIIGGIMLGIIAAFLITTVYKKTTCAFVQCVLSKGAVGKENAIVFSELGVSRRFLKKLMAPGVLRRTVVCLDEEDFCNNAETLDGNAPSGDFIPYKITESDRIYVPEDKKYFAQIHFDMGGASWRRFIFIALVCVAGFFVLMNVVPMLLDIVDSFIGSI